MYKITRFYVAVGLFYNRWQKTSNYGKNISDSLSCASCATFLSLPCFYVVCDLLQNGRMATWNRFIQYCISKFLCPSEYTAFCNPLLGQESIAFLIGNLKTYCQRAEDEQKGDAVGEFQVYFFFPCENMFSI